MLLTIQKDLTKKVATLELYTNSPLWQRLVLWPVGEMAVMPLVRFRLTKLTVK